jgi:heat-inducible transcriptional repressor
VAVGSIGLNMLDDRKASILRAVVEEYIQTGQPVGSAHVAQLTGLAVSSATVRNDMGGLEREGYLVQPHTSAGRVPTDKGYRFFVDSLTTPGVLQPAQRQEVRSFFAKAHGELERMLADTSRLLSGLTDYAAVVVPPSVDALTIRSVQLVSLGPRLVMVVVVLSNGSIEKRVLDLASDVTDAVVSAASAHLSTTLVRTVWGGAGSLLSAGDPAVDELVRLSLASISSPGSTHEAAYVGGVARMASAFEAVDTIRQVLTILEQQYVVVGLISDVLDRGLSVAIGAEHGLQSLADCSVVVAPYNVEGEQGGTVAILGPTRMHYDHALAAVAVVSRQLTRALSEGA